MHIALVVDPERLPFDGVAIERLAVAMAADTAQVTRIVPPSAVEAQGSRLIPVRTLDFDGSILFRRSRLGALSSALAEQRPDVFVSFGARAFAACVELAGDMGAALIAMISTQDELTRTPLRRHLDLLDAVGVPTGPLAVRAARVVPPELVSVIPLGIGVPASPPPAAPQSVAIAGSARDVGAYRAVFAALADVAPALPDLQVAIEFPPGHDTKLWGIAREYHIQSILNGVQRLEQIRPLALSCGVFMVPEPVHGTRTLLLEAMASGRTVLAMEDSMANYLIDDVTALLAKDRDPRTWTRMLTRALLEPQVAQALGTEGALRTAAVFSSSRCATLLLEACAAAVRGPAIPFPSTSTPT